MTDEQIEKAAQQYADNNFIESVVKEEPWPEAKVAYAKAFRDGAAFALSHEWVSVDERLPEYNTTCLVFGHQDFGDGMLARYTMMAHYDGENFYDAYNDRKYHPEMWMPIPAIPQLNPEKQSI